ncbi:AEC family transporter [Roseibium sp.]|uniref:AEC family transporter n=1 Tax=Roseibium sp. TaxID=1936156 RepID=UPI003A97D7B0
MLDVLSITSVIFLLIAVGRFVVWRGIFDASGMRVLGAYVVNIALPCLIFNALNSSPIAEIFEPGYLIAFAAGSMIMLFGAYLISRKVLGMTGMESTFQGLGMSCANSGFVGYPILHIAMPAIAPLVLAHNMVVETLMMLPLVLMLAERAQNAHLTGRRLALQIGKRLAANPIIWAMATGILFSLSGLHLPGPLAQSADLLASSSAAVSLIVIGGSLGNLSLRSINVKVITIVAGKLLIMPVVMAVVAFSLVNSGLITVAPDMLTALILSAGMPTMSLIPILALIYNAGEEPGVALALSTALSFITISLLLWGLGVTG